MTNAEWVVLLRRIPEAEHSKLAFVLQTGAEAFVDALLRFDDSFVVFRGRIAGSTDELRGFFLPYDQILCLRLDRIVRVEELHEFFPNTLESNSRKSGSLETPLIPPSERPTPTVAPDPAVASKLLLERIRAVRADIIRQIPVPARLRQYLTFSPPCSCPCRAVVVLPG